jgi:hypothetical protein
MVLAIGGASVASSAQVAAAASSEVNLWAVPVTSCIDDGKLQFLRLKFKLENVDPLESIKITIDPGTPGEKVLEFNGNGAVLSNDLGTVSIDGSINIKTDGYFLLALLSGKFKVGFDKMVLSAGDHDALAEIFTEGASSAPSDTAEFTLKACGTGKPDLVAESYVAPNNIKQDKKYNTVFLETNGGNAKADKHTVKVYLSEDNVLDTSTDQLVGESQTGKLPVNPVRVVHVKVEIPCGPETGDMFLIAWTDANKVVNESNEGNNVASDPVNVVGCEETSSASTASDDDGDDDKGKPDKVKVESSNKGKGKDK